MKEKNITMEEAGEKIGNYSQEELIKDIFSSFEPEMNDFFISIIEDSISTVGTISEDTTIKLEKQNDGSWKISDME